ncbi:geranylgeranyl reductase family protein [Fodinicola acaciae]|uniref:geranylgeranyl reductase family protein n=1 Tax=Fodinicola acaciae TaxID=2681555 RepID=UPI001C9E9073
MSTAESSPTGTADVIVVGAGPSGSTAAFYLAQAGLDVLVLEKTEFPREKVCGDGLTPRAVKELVKMGVDIDEKAGWIRNRGLRVIGGGVRLELPWPDLASYPNYGLVRPRLDFDDVLARNAVKAGARLQTLSNVTGPILNRAGRLKGVTAKVGPDKQEARYEAPLVLSGEGVSGRLAIAMGLQRREDRPMGVAVRRYYKSPRHDDDFLESWLELRDSASNSDVLLPGYGWIFGVGDGRSNVGLGVLNSSTAFQGTDFRKMMVNWLDGLPEEWGYTEENADGPIRGAALPMGFNRTPHYTRGLLLMGDSGGMVNPFNGEGIAYAMESAGIAAEIAAQALARPAGPQRERVLYAYPKILKDTYGGYYRLGKIFVDLLGHPATMKLATRYGMPRPMLMRFVLKLLANLTDPHASDSFDRIINAMKKVAPAV